MATVGQNESPRAMSAVELLLATVCAFLLLHSFWALATGWSHTILDEFGFRQAQTAISIDYLLKGGPWVAYETPVLGPPWSLPFEFPFYQWIAAITAKCLGMGVDQAGRLVSVLFFGISFVPLLSVLRKLGLSRPQRWPFVILLLASPTYLFWSRTVLIESCALCVGLTYLALAVGYLQRPSWKIGVLVALVGGLSAMVKITTFFGFAICSVLLWTNVSGVDLRKVKANLRANLAIGAYLIAVPCTLGLAWTRYADSRRALCPLADFTLDKAVTAFTLGTPGLRISRAYWDAIWNRGVPDIIGSNLLIPPLLVMLPFLRSQRRRCVLAAAVFLVPTLTFANLHFVHKYYQYETGIFLIGALAFCIADLLAQDIRGAVAGCTLLALTVGLGLSRYHETYFESQAQDNLTLSSTAKAIQENTGPGEAVVIYGEDWSSALPYYAGRRAIMLRDGAPPSAPRVQREIANLGRHPIGAMAMCLDARASDPHPEALAAAYGLGPAPQYSDASCTLFFTPGRSKAAASILFQPVVGAAHPTTGSSLWERTTAPQAIPRGWEGSVDLVNGRPVPMGNSAIEPLNISGHIEVQGWAATDAKSGEPFETLYLVLGDQQVRASSAARPDVAQYYRNTRLAYAGFSFAGDTVAIPKGVYPLRIIAAAHDGTYYDCRRLVYVRIE